MGDDSTAIHQKGRLPMRKQLKFKKNHSPNKRDEAVG
jgi:hypothetical protein